MGKVRPWCGQPSDRGRLKNRTEQSCCGSATARPCSCPLAAGPTAANPLQRRAVAECWDRRTDGRTPNRYINPALHTSWALPISERQNITKLLLPNSAAKFQPVECLVQCIRILRFVLCHFWSHNDVTRCSHGQFLQTTAFQTSVSLCQLIRLLTGVCLK